MTAIARVSVVSKSYGEGRRSIQVLSDVSFDLEAGQVTLLMGPSGSGKTTVLSILAGLVQPTSGDVTLCGRTLRGLGESERASLRRRHVGFVFQTHHLFPALSALANVVLAYRMRGVRRREALERATRLLGDLGLGERLAHRPDALSNGERQRVAIARAFAGEPALIVADEPTASLDGAGARGVMELLRARLSPTSGALVVTHDKRLERHADRLLVLEDGRLVE